MVTRLLLNSKHQTSKLQTLDPKLDGGEARATFPAYLPSASSQRSQETQGWGAGPVDQDSGSFSEVFLVILGVCVGSRQTCHPRSCLGYQPRMRVSGGSRRRRIPHHHLAALDEMRPSARTLVSGESAARERGALRAHQAPPYHREQQPLGRPHAPLHLFPVAPPGSRQMQC
jgi:hypothetical protein